MMKKMSKPYNSRKTALAVIGMLFLTSACTGLLEQTHFPAANAPMAAATGTTIPSPTPTPKPSELTICTADEPESLYCYDGRNSESKQTIFSVIYNTPMVLEAEMPGFITRLPSAGNGIRVETIPVTAGEVFMDPSGALNVLKEGVRVRPAGCSTTDCVYTWDGESPVEMDQVTVTWEFKPDAKWADGTDLTAKDSLFSYQAASQPDSPVNQWMVDRTERVEAPDALHFQWVGLPGFNRVDMSKTLWMPLPSYQLEGVPWNELPESEVLKTTPLGWGAFRLVTREPGKQLVFEKNPYSLIENNLLLDVEKLTIRFLPDRQEALSQFEQGACDILDSSYALEQLELKSLPGTVHLREPVQTGELVFGIQHQEGAPGKTAWFTDLNTRRAVQSCLISDEFAQPLSPDLLIKVKRAQLTFPGEPLAGLGDPAVLLETAGWKDADQNPQTPRTAEGIEGIEDGTPFSITLLSGKSAADLVTAQAIIRNLQQCGIQVNHNALPPEELYAAGPEGLVFGRQFDLVLVNWQGHHTNKPDNCLHYVSSQVPGAANYWVGTNLAGLRDADFDLACVSGLGSESAATPGWSSAEQARLNQLPAIDLVPHYQFWISQPALNLP